MSGGDRLSGSGRRGRVVVVDSGSTDGSPGRARQLGARVHEIPGASSITARRGTSAPGSREATCLVFTTQDADAAGEVWLSALIAPLRSDGVAGVYGRQLPHDDATPPERYFLDFLYGPSPRVQRVEDRAQLTFEATLFSNVNSAIPRDVGGHTRSATT